MNEQLLPKEENNEKKEMISFSEIDENGVFREAYGYIEKRDNDDKSFEERIKEMQERIKKR